MPWVWSDELADCLEGLGDVVEPGRIRHWRSAPTAYAVPVGGDLVGFARDLLGVGEWPMREADREGSRDESGCGTAPAELSWRLGPSQAT